MADNDIKIYINKELKSVNPSPFIEDGRTYVPIKFVAENFGAVVDWDAEHRKVTINQSGKIITLYINSKQATINNRLVDIDAAPMIVENRTVVPLRFITENLGLKTEWDNTTKSILLSDTIVKYPKNNKDENVIIPISTVDSYSIKVNNDGTRIAKLTLNKANNNVIVGGNIIIPFNDRYTTGVILEIIKDTDNPNKLVIICTELEVPEECKR